MSYEFYKILHLAGIFLMTISLSMGILTQKNSWNKSLSIGHGVGLLIALVAGFGLLARMGMHSSWPGWVFVKLLVWVLLGGFLVLVKRKVFPTLFLTSSLWILLSFAAFTAITKPF